MTCLNANVPLFFVLACGAHMEMERWGPTKLDDGELIKQAGSICLLVSTTNIIGFRFRGVKLRRDQIERTTCVQKNNLGSIQVGQKPYEKVQKFCFQFLFLIFQLFPTTTITGGGPAANDPIFSHAERENGNWMVQSRGKKQFKDKPYFKTVS